MRCEHEHDDGAYVLGALSPSERRAYEGHLATCSFCREAVRDISNLPDLLSRLDAAEFAKIVDPILSGSELPVADRSSSVARHSPAGRRRNRKTMRVRVLSSAVVAVLVALAGFGVVEWTQSTAEPTDAPAGPAAAMTPVDGISPVSATVRLTSTPGGTRVDMVCSYSESATRPHTFRLVALGPDAEQEQLGSWQASPGATFRMPAVTHFTGGKLWRLELVQYDGKVLLGYNVP